MILSLNWIDSRDTLIFQSRVNLYFGAIEDKMIFYFSVIGYELKHVNGKDTLIFQSRVKRTYISKECIFVI
jgi:hypothetical protein